MNRREPIKVFPGGKERQMRERACDWKRDDDDRRRDDDDGRRRHDGDDRCRRNKW
jgi:hypothetical protein